MFRVHILEKRGLDLGLFFLMIAVLASLALERIGIKEILITLSGFLAIAGGIIATRLNGMGLTLLDNQPQIILGLVIGSLICIAFLKGMPVGPLMAGGITAFFLYLLKLIGH